MSKEAYYFSHDSNARNDLKIIKLRRQLGLEGYGAYWCLIEMLREADEQKLPLSGIDDLAYSFGISSEKLTTVIKSYDLFKLDEDSFYSERLRRNMAQYAQLKEVRTTIASNAAKVRWNAPKSGTKNKKNKNDGFVM